MVYREGSCWRHCPWKFLENWRCTYNEVGTCTESCLYPFLRTKVRFTQAKGLCPGRGCNAWRRPFYFFLGSVKTATSTTPQTSFWPADQICDFHVSASYVVQLKESNDSCIKHASWSRSINSWIRYLSTAEGCCFKLWMTNSSTFSIYESHDYQLFDLQIVR